MKIIYSQKGELIELAKYLKNMKEEVCVHVHDKEAGKKVEGVEKSADLKPYLGKGCVWVFESNEPAALQDWLREKGEKVEHAFDTFLAVRNGQYEERSKKEIDVTEDELRMGDEIRSAYREMKGVKRSIRKLLVSQEYAKGWTPTGDVRGGV